MSKLKKYILIIDYNLSRYDDVKMMAEYALSKYGLRAILIRPNPSSIDQLVADHIINLDPRSEGFIEDAIRCLSSFANDIQAGLVFSDNAVFSGAKLLESLGLETDSALMAESAYSKIKYRQAESENINLWNKQNIFVPNFKVIYTLDEVIEFSQNNPNGFVLKPACEGNNRGVMLLREGDNLDEALSSIMPYLKDGLICEELIQFEEEYSFDGISHLTFITKKLSKKSKYPVEYGQIVSGEMDTRTAELIARAGAVANMIVGQCRGPFHNEIKLSLEKDQAAIIEPNRRPAGMKIWSLAEKVFGYDFYQLWIDRVVAKKLPSKLPPAKGVSAIRMLGAPCDGVFKLPVYLSNNSDLLFKKFIEQFKKHSHVAFPIEWFGFQLNKKTGDDVVKVQKDNSDFIAQICIYLNDSRVDVIQLLDQINDCWLDYISVYVQSQRGEAA
ncbi:MAG: biotin carboxylase [Gammaproteobacteria bacterium]|nr:biotin carboxylase [Gammaproteobacteria bacterium]